MGVAEICRPLPCIEQKFYFVQLKRFLQRLPRSSQSCLMAVDQSHVSFLHLAVGCKKFVKLPYYSGLFPFMVENNELTL